MHLADQRTPRLSVVVPAFNEAVRLEDRLPRLIDSISWDDVELIIVDDGSTDGTGEVARRALRGLPDHSIVRLARNSGKGAAVRAGVVRAEGEFIAYMDADMATDPSDLIRLVAQLDRSHVAVGSRALGGSVVDSRSPHRVLMTRTFGLLVTATLNLAVNDTQCGFKAFHGSVAKLLFHGCRVDSFGFDIDVLQRASRLGLEVAEVPVRWTDVEGSKVRVVQDSLRMLGDVRRAARRPASDPPIYGVALTDTEPAAGAALLRSKVRPVHTVLQTQGGAMALFPCVPPTVAQGLGRRLVGALPGRAASGVEVRMRDLERPGRSDGGRAA